jgi:hypothetical protein
MENVFVEVIGWVGAGFLLTAYGLNSYGKIASNSLIYQVLNMIASVFLITNTIYHNALPSTLINIIWIVIGSIAIYKNSKK